MFYFGQNGFSLFSAFVQPSHIKLSLFSLLVLDSAMILGAKTANRSHLEFCTSKYSVLGSNIFIFPVSSIQATKIIQM